MQRPIILFLVLGTVLLLQLSDTVRVPAFVCSPGRAVFGRSMCTPWISQRRRCAALTMQEFGLLDWAKSRGAFVSSKVGLRGEKNARTVIAIEKVEEGETVFKVPTSMAVSAKGAREQVLSVTGSKKERGDPWMCEAEAEDAWLTLWIVMSLRGDLPDCGWQAYAEDLRDQRPDLPVLWDDDSSQHFNSHIRQRVAVMKKEMQSCVSVCKAIVQDLQNSVRKEGAVEASDSELQSAWALVRSRAIRESDASSGVVHKKLFPIVDAMNHEPSGTSGQAAATYSSLFPQSNRNSGAAVRVSYADDYAIFTATRSISAGSQVTWSYGRLSNEDLLTVYGFVPTEFVHGDNRVGFSLPSELFRKSLEALSKGCSSDLMDRKMNLLRSLGVVTDNANIELKFETYMGEEPKLTRDTGLPVPLSIIVRYMCLSTSDELALNCLGVGGEFSPIDPPNEVRAMRWMMWLVSQVEEQIFSADVRSKDLAELAVSRPTNTTHERQINTDKVLASEYLVLKCARELYAIKEASASALSQKAASGPIPKPTTQGTTSKGSKSLKSQPKPKGFGR